MDETRFDHDREPELADIFEDDDPPAWVVEAATRAIETDGREAATWADALALALGRRANRMLRDSIGPNPSSL